MNTGKKILILLGTLLGVGAGATIVASGSGKGGNAAEKLSKKISKTPEGPRQLSIKDWRRAFQETKAALGDKNLPMLAAGVAFFATLAFFPTLAAFVAIFALAADPNQIADVIRAAEVYLPREMAELVNTQLDAAIGKPRTNILIAVFSIALALWSASSGVQNMIKALNEAYGVDEKRGFIKLKSISIALVLGGILIGLPLLLLLVVQPDWLMDAGAPLWLANSFMITRWVLAILIMIVGLAALYRYGPDRENPKWQWVSWGAVAAILIWLAGTALFFYYAQNLSDFGSSYGVFAGIIVLMIWFNLSSFVFLLGAQVNKRLESQAIGATS